LKCKVLQWHRQETDQENYVLTENKENLAVGTCYRSLLHISFVTQKKKRVWFHYCQFITTILMTSSGIILLRPCYQHYE